VLQEVTRGWMINERHDLLGILGARLGMRVVFGPQIGDLYGNALLSRLPVSEIERVRYLKEPGLRYLPRGALLARVAGTVIAVTHLDHNADASRVRQDQVRTLLGAWNGRLPAIVVGDLNAPPGSPELKLLADAGFRDLAEQSGAVELTFPAGRPTERIDYAWGIGVTAAQAHVVATTAADHRPLVLNVTPSR
ncbi:MAG: endonuclease/exonuclease/phosphatase family protein, partial [Candidatus Limnocylindria bacterium]|nr:endonuclease/exonuclease/phosphatase family protein [Candidatus Limnocylindria bacterium]